MARKDKKTGLLQIDDFTVAANELVKSAPIQWCCIAFDIQHFKIFVRWFGREKSDFVIGRIGGILCNLEKENVAVAGYLGRDNFVVVMEHDYGKIQQLYEEVKSVVSLYSNNIGFMPAFGVYVIEDTINVSTEAYDKAKTASEDAKKSYSERIKYLDTEKYTRRKHDYEQLTEFQQALQDREISFYIQPQCIIGTSKIVGGEALARWVKKDGSIVSPGMFIPFLEKYGFIMELDKYIWESVCIWLRKLIDKGIHPVPISINVSKVELLSMDVSAYLYALTSRFNIPPSLLNIEITESAYAENFTQISQAVGSLKSKGFKVYMDDFGAGYSSLNMLDKVNTDVLKLDMAFMKKEDSLSRRGISIVESIISMTKTLGIPIVIEGVETSDQIKFLSGLGCRYAQGYYYYKPMPVDEFAALISSTQEVDGKQEPLVDYNGVTVRSTDLFHTREFLNEELFNDTMLNNILGPVAFYTQCSSGDVNIVRFNKQFYDCIGDMNMESRQRAIQNYIVEEDVPVFNKMFEDATTDPVNGGECTVRFYKSGGGTFWYNMHVYYLREKNGLKWFYGKIAHVTSMHAQGAAFYELLKSSAYYCLRIDINNELIYELGRDRPFDDPDARVMDSRESLRITANEHIEDPDERKRFVDFFSPERLRHSLDSGVYSETFRTRFRTGGSVSNVIFAAYYIKFLPDQDDNVYVFINREY